MPADGVLGIYVTVPPLDERFLDRVPTAAQEFHRRYLDDLGLTGPPESAPAIRDIDAAPLTDATGPTRP